MHKARFDRRELIKKSLALGAAGYVGPKIVGTVATVNAQSISGAVCSTSSCAGPLCQNNCACVTIIDGPITCVEPTCSFASPCATSADCGQGFVCFTAGCCDPGHYCVPLCGTVGGNRERVSGKTWH